MSTYTVVSTFTRAEGPGITPPKWYLAYNQDTEIQHIIVPTATEDDFQVGDYLTLVGTIMDMNSTSLGVTQAEITAVGDTTSILNGSAESLPGRYASFVVPAGFTVGQYSVPMNVQMSNMITMGAGPFQTIASNNDPAVATFERSSGGGGGSGGPGPDNSSPIDAAGNVRVDHVWGNIPMQPNTQRPEDAQLDPDLDNHYIAISGWNGFPGYIPNFAPPVAPPVTVVATFTPGDGFQTGYVLGNEASMSGSTPGDATIEGYAQTSLATLLGLSGSSNPTPLTIELFNATSDALLSTYTVNAHEDNIGMWGPRAFLVPAEPVSSLGILDYSAEITRVSVLSDGETLRIYVNL